MAESATERPPPAAAAPETSTEVAEATSTSAPTADVAAAVPPATDDAPSKAEEPTATSNDTVKSTEPATTNALPATTEDKTTVSMNGDKAEAPGEETVAANATPDTGKKDNKRRKSTVPEHKNKTLKKKQSQLHLDLKPGQFWFVRMKGYPRWPAVVCDNDMLPEPLIANRPVSAMRIDGSYREDFLEGGKNARDRRYPVMFLGTNEFNWVVNTELEPLDMDEIKAEVEKGERGKKSVALWQAYQACAEEPTLEELKEMLVAHEKHMREEAEEVAAKEAKKEEEKKKKAALKAAKDKDGDESMGGTGDSGKKATKKRRKSGDGNEETPQGPKKIKIKHKEPDVADEEPKEKKVKKQDTKKGGVKTSPPKPAEPQISEKEKLDKKEKHVLYLRHRLQKGFLSRDQAPKEEEMNDMNNYFDQLEVCSDLEVQIIRATKINKVLKAILKLDTIPKDDEYRFKERSNTLLNAWNKILASTGTNEGDAGAGETPTTEAPKPALNGAGHDEESKKSDEPHEAAEAPKEGPPAAAGDADVSMTDAKPAEPEAVPAAPAPAAEAEGKPAPVAQDPIAV